MTKFLKITTDSALTSAFWKIWAYNQP